MSLIIPANTLASGGYEVANSLRFNSGSSDYLRVASPTAGDRQKGTVSFWVKRAKLGATQFIYEARQDEDNHGYLYFNSSDDLVYFSIGGGATQSNLVTDRKFRDVSAFYNIVFNFNTTLGTADDRHKFFVNGVQETSFSQRNNPSQNANLAFSQSNHPITIGRRGDGANYFGGYLSEFVRINDTLDPTSFGEFDEDSGIWKPISVSGLTFGNNGFYLEFKQAGTGTNSSGMGADTSGNDNHFAVNNLTAVDQSTDTCTNNSATWNSLVHFSTSATFSEGNLKVAPTENTSRVYTVSTIGMPTVSGSKWYAEFKYLETNDVAIIGILDAAQISYVFRNNSDLDNQNGDTSVGRVTYRVGNGLIKFPSGQSVDSSVTLTNNDIVMIALDSGSGKIWFGVNGTWFNSGNPATGSNGVDFTGQSWWTAGVDDFVFFVGDGNTGGHDDWEANFGSPPYSESGGETDGNGYGNFAHAVPSGYYSLNTKNLAEYG